MEQEIKRRNDRMSEKNDIKIIEWMKNWKHYSMHECKNE